MKRTHCNALSDGCTCKLVKSNQKDSLHKFLWEKKRKKKKFVFTVSKIFYFFFCCVYKLTDGKLEKKSALSCVGLSLIYTHINVRENYFLAETKFFGQWKICCWRWIAVQYWLLYGDFPDCIFLDIIIVDLIHWIYICVINFCIQ